MMFRVLAVWTLLLLWAGTAATAQVCPSDCFGPTSCFRVYDASGQPLDIPGQTRTVLCAGATIRLRDCSGQNYNPANVRYALDCLAVPDTSTTRTVPPLPPGQTTGQLIIKQATLNPTPGPPCGSGQQFSRLFEVRTRPTPTFTFAYCGSTRSQVYVSLTNAQANIRYEVQVGSGPRQAVTNPAGAVYTAAPGATTITVFGNYTDARLCEGSTSLNYPAQPAPVVPLLPRLQVQGNDLLLSFGPLQSEYRYVLEQDAGSGFQRLADIPATASSYTVPGGALTSCYRLRLTDACGVLSLPSAPLCPVDLQVSSANRQNRLSWTQRAGSPVADYQVLRNDQPLATVAAAQREYLDQAVTCGVTYRYRVVARSPGATSESVERSVQTVANQAPPAPLLTASFRVDGAVEINPATPLTDPDSRLLVRRRLGTAAVDVPVPAQLPVVDQPGEVSPERVPCYAARLSDPCGNVSTEGASACPPVLAALALDRDGNQIGLTWTEPQGQGSGWTYQLLLLDAEGREISRSAVSPGSFPVQAPVPPADRQVLRYRLAATSTAGLTVFSNVASITRQLVFAIPTAFTPNGDGLNDVLEIKGRFLKSFSFTLFDRSGLVVFRATERSQTWDGRIRGVEAAPQVFPFQFETTDETGRRIVQRGTVTLLR
ncbi:gliding motility-associated C-terminal domain-containing protein [Hymenobacter gummosus]|nr:gliding motility-associated C-terminal domain-containing protein [Hymenobacter gummosus]